MRTHFKEKNMKMSKRIFIVLLTLAVLATSFALYASASTEPVSGVNCDSLLAYLEEDVIFGYDFGEGEIDYSGSLMLGRPESVTQSFVSDDTAPGGKYLQLEIGSSGPKIKSVYLNWNSEAGVGDFYFDTTLSGDKNGANAPKYQIIVDDEIFDKVSEGNTYGVNLVTLDFAAGGISYVSGAQVDGDKTTYVTTDLEYTLTLGAWYSVSLDYSAEQGAATLTVANVADPSDSVTVSDVYLPFDVVKNVRFGVHKAQAEGALLKLASVCSATGSVRFNVTNRQKGIEDGILKVYQSYTSSDISIDDKLVVCDIVNKIVASGFVTENADVNAAIADINLGSINLYANALASLLENYSTLDNYYAKRAVVDSGLEYAAVLEDTDLSPVAPEDLAVILEDIAAVRDTDKHLEKVEADSNTYIALLTELGENVSSSDYGFLLGYYDNVSVLDVDHTYDGVSDLDGVYSALVSNLDSIKYEAESFMAELALLADTERDFMDRYYEYLEFTVYENETYPGITEALAQYNDVVLPDILANIGYAESYITYIDRANFASYITAKEENVKLADEYADLMHPDFPGVSEAKVLREKVLEYVKVQKENAAAYISAVNALDTLSGNELLKGIENAQKLQKSGNVLGVPGVAEANIKLNQLMSNIELKTRYSEYFVSLVDSLNYVYKAEDVYNILIEAKHAEAKADQTYPGVSEASVDLEAIIEDYNDGVYFYNYEFVDANLIAANTVGIGETANTVADNVIAIIQNVLEDEDEDEE